jgi:hypothetical protein
LNPAADPNFLLTPTTTFDVSVTSGNNLPVAYYNQSVYQDANNYQTAYTAAEFISYGILAAGMFCDKIIGI